MQLGNPLLALHSALAAALHRDLPDISYSERDWTAWRSLSKDQQADAIKNNTAPHISRTRRPQDYDVEVVMFPQTWGSTALGYGGMGGASMTPAYTVVVQEGDCSCVYFGRGELAYRIIGNSMTPAGRERWFNDLQSQNLAGCMEAASRYV